MKRNWKIYVVAWLGLIFVFMLALILAKTMTFKGVKSELGKNVVKMLYEFRSVDSLEFQMSALKNVTTEDVYNQLTVDNEERLLNTYLKFNEEASKVVVEKATDSYVIYSLDCKTIDSTRKFIFMFSVNDDGKICWVRECELIDFIVGE